MGSVIKRDFDRFNVAHLRAIFHSKERTASSWNFPHFRLVPVLAPAILCAQKGGRKRIVVECVIQLASLYGFFNAGHRVIM